MCIRDRSNRNPGGQMRKKKSEYALQLTEKQKVKFVYGIMEKQFRMYYDPVSYTHLKRIISTTESPRTMLRRGLASAGGPKRERLPFGRGGAAEQSEPCP